MVTIKAVALEAGMSVASVSRVINGAVVRGDTTKKVLVAIHNLNYQPNSAARALKVRQSEQICLSFDDLANPAYVLMTRGVGQVLSKTKYRLILSSAFSSVEEIVKHLQTMGRGYADGLIISPIYTDRRITELIAQLQIPVVFIGILPEGLDIDHVYVDSALGISKAVKHLHDTGRKKIGLLNGPVITNPGRMRLDAFVKVMKDLDLPFSQNQVFQAESFSIAAGYKSASNITKIRTFDGFLCTNDLLAAGFMKYCHEQKIEIPRDIAVVGVDNGELTSIMQPTLTSVDLHAEKRGQLAAQLMLERLSDPSRKTQVITVEPTLVVRESSVVL